MPRYCENGDRAIPAWMRRSQSARDGRAQSGVLQMCRANGVGSIFALEGGLDGTGSHATNVSGMRGNRCVR